MRTLAALGKQVLVLKDGDVLPAPGINEADWQSARYTLPYSPPTWAAIASLLRHPWFSRVWILQEVLLSAEAQFVCGDEEISRETFGGTLYLLKFKTELGQLLSRRLIKSVALVVMPAVISTWSISSPVRMTHEAHCTLDKDSISGALGLFPTSFRSRITVDCSLATDVVYTNFVRSHIEHVKRLEMLRMCDLRYQRLPRLPSWVPDFYDTPTVPLGIGNWSFCSGYSASEVSFRDGILEAAGVCAATIQSVSDVIPNHESDTGKKFANTVRALQKARDFFENFNIETRVRDGPEAFIWTILGSFLQQRLPDNYLPLPREGLRQATGQSDIFCAQYAANAIESKVSLVEDFCLRMMMGERVVVTTDGHWGISPAATQKGDKIACFLDADAPAILREVGNGECKVVGECLLPELADLRAFLGPLPRPWIVRFFKETIEGTGEYRYPNTDTGVIIDQDPRLGNLPKAVEIVPRDEVTRTRDDPRLFQVYKHRRTGIEEISDPRLKRAALKGRGIHIEQITLH